MYLLQKIFEFEEGGTIAQSLTLLQMLHSLNYPWSLEPATSGGKLTKVVNFSNTCLSATIFRYFLPRKLAMKINVMKYLFTLWQRWKKELKIIFILNLELWRRSMNEENIENILQTVLVPSQPPNRSQWRKLELALKFIHNSKKSVKQKESRKCKSVDEHKHLNLKAITDFETGQKFYGCIQRNLLIDGQTIKSRYPKVMDTFSWLLDSKSILSSQCLMKSFKNFQQFNPTGWPGKKVKSLRNNTVYIFIKV